MSTKKKKRDKMSYTPSVPWEECMEELLASGRYPYIFPTVPECGPHPLVKGEPVPGGTHTYPRGNSAKPKLGGT